MKPWMKMLLWLAFLIFVLPTLMGLAFFSGWLVYVFHILQTLR